MNGGGGMSTDQQLVEQVECMQWRRVSETHIKKFCAYSAGAVEVQKLGFWICYHLITLLGTMKLEKV